jgi:hypothetical protein
VRLLAAPAVVLAIFAAGIGHDGTGPRLALVHPPGPCARVPVRLPTGTAVEGGGLAGFDFLSPSVGVGLTAAQLYCEDATAAPEPTGRALPVRLVETTDAGRHWEVEGAGSLPGPRPGAWPVPPAPPLQIGTGAPMPVALAFSSRRAGWAEVGGELSFTNDGGGSWKVTRLGGPVVSLAGAGREALAVTSGNWELWRLASVAGRWRAVSKIPVARRPTEAFLTLGPAPSDAVVATSHYGGAPPLIAETSNGGQTWQTARDPCGPPHWLTASALTESATGTMAALCVGGAAAGSATHGFYVSHDRGRRWLLRAADTDLARPNPSGLPRQDTFVVMAAPAPGRFYIGTENTFFVSADGGRRWKRVLEGYNGYGVSVMDFLSPRYGWALLGDGPLGSGLVATSDGLHWGLP